jgi:hypothetical protein
MGCPMSDISCFTWINPPKDAAKVYMPHVWQELGELLASELARWVGTGAVTVVAVHGFPGSRTRLTPVWRIARTAVGARILPNQRLKKVRPWKTQVYSSNNPTV